MAAISKNKSLMPGSSWEVVKKIIRAYHAVAREENPTGESVSKLAGLPRQVVSSNNNFLRALGILQQDQFKLTEIGSRLALGMTMNNKTMMRESLQEAVRQSDRIRDLLNILGARGEMKLIDFKGEIMHRLRLTPDHWQVPYIKTLFDFLQESELMTISDDSVSLVVEPPKKDEDSLSSNEHTPPAPKDYRQPANNQHGDRVPLPLGASRLAYIELPPDWNKKELRKLIKLLEISLGDDEEGASGH